MRYATALGHVYEQEVVERQGIAAGVGTAVVHHHDLIADLDRVSDRGESFRQPGALIIDRQDDGYLGGAFA
jgi:hypothetical protein